VVYIDQAEGSRSLRMFTQPGQRALAHTTASGKAILAFRVADELEAMFPAVLERLTSKTIGTLAALASDLERVRTRGYAIDHEEHEDGVSCVAAPIRNGAGTPVAAVSVSGPTPRIISADTTRLGERVVEAAKDASTRLERR
jgi:DNA-binding IclR family transcriptional regulator